MGTGIDPKVDYAFKRLFGVPDKRFRLIALLNAVLDPPAGQLVVDVQILNPFSVQDLSDDKLSIVDVKARDQSGRHFAVEMQLLVYSDLPKRLLYYWAGLYREQIKSGVDYDQLSRTIVIAFLCEPLFPRTSRYHSKFELIDDQQGVAFSDDLEMHTIELSKFDRTATNLKTPLDCWSYFLIHGPELQPNELPEPLQQAMEIRDATQELEMIAQNEQDHDLYEARKMFQMDQRALCAMQTNGAGL